MTTIRLPHSLFAFASGLALLVVAPLGCGSGTRAADGGTDTGTVPTSGGLPAGYTAVVALPSAATSHPENYGLNPSIAFDAMGDPAVAFTWYDPDNDDNKDDSTVYFARWNRAAGRFDAPVRVGTAGDVGYRARMVSLAYDASSSTFGVAFATYTNDHYGVSVAVSATGASFTAADVGRSETGPISPSLAMGGGRVHLALLSNRNVSYVTGSETGAPGTWTSTMAPTLADQDNVAGVPSIALDSGGAPAIAYFATPSSAYNTRAAFWRPGGAPSVAFDTQNHQNDDPYLSLAFRGTTAVVAAQVSRSSGDEAALYVATSADGAAWSGVATVPPDDGANPGRVYLAVGAAGQGAITYDSGGGSSGTCGQPKLARSTDLTTWTTCSPDATDALSIDPTNPTAGFGAGDKLVLAFNNRGSSRSGALAGGLYVWREP